MRKYFLWGFCIMGLLFLTAQSAKAVIAEYAQFSGYVRLATGEPCPAPLTVTCRVSILMEEYVWDVYLLDWRCTGYTRVFNSDGVGIVDPNTGHYSASVRQTYEDTVEIEPDPENPGPSGTWRRVYHGNGTMTILSNQLGWACIGQSSISGSYNDYTVQWVGTPYFQIVNSIWMPAGQGNSTVDLPKVYSPKLYYYASGPTYNHSTSCLKIEKCVGGIWSSCWELDMSKLPSRPITGEINENSLMNSQLRMTLCDDGAQSSGERRPWAMLYFK
jgi:hypothetical protein